MAQELADEREETDAGTCDEAAAVPALQQSSMQSFVAGLEVSDLLQSHQAFAGTAAAGRTMKGVVFFFAGIAATELAHYAVSRVRKFFSDALDVYSEMSDGQLAHGRFKKEK